MLHFRLQNGLKGQGWWSFIREFQGKFAYTRQKSADGYATPLLSASESPCSADGVQDSRAAFAGWFAKVDLMSGGLKIEILFTANLVTRLITYDIFRRLKQGIKVFGNIHSCII